MCWTDGQLAVGTVGKEAGKCGLSRCDVCGLGGGCDKEQRFIFEMLALGLFFFFKYQIIVIELHKFRGV